MRGVVRRVAGLVRRYRVDRRLPPTILSFFRTTQALRRRHRADVRAAQRHAPIGAGTAPADAPIRRLADRRVVVAGPTSNSSHDAALDQAEWFVAVCERAGVRPFVVERLDDRLRFGLRLDDRRTALVGLGDAATAGRHLRWRDRNADGLVALADAPDDRRARVAREWTIFESTEWGDRATGPERGVVVTFYDIGSSGEYELIGTRGHDRFDRRCTDTVERIWGREFPGNSAYPIGASLAHFEEPIDIVYTWVDGADPVWIEAFRSTAAEHGRDVDEAALNAARYRSRDELRYSLRSIAEHCGWVNHVWVVTAGQRPSWLVEDDRLSVVDHADILPADAIPTFNSHAIESALHHIDDLAEHFLYVNDDMLVARSLRPETFFTSNGLAKVFQSGAPVPGVEDEHTQAVDTGARRGRELLLERFGRTVIDKPLHAPYPNRRSALFDLEREFPEIVKRTRHSRFRSATDLSIAASFAQHYAVATGRAVFGELIGDYAYVESDRLRWSLDRVLYGDDIDTFCLNETHAVDGDHGDRDAMIDEFFEQLLPVPSPWEQPPSREGDAARATID
ncbi:MAG: stealth family protein [Actinomycetota bacterium]